MTHTALKDHMPLALIVNLFTSGPAGILGLSLPIIEEGAPANLCVFDPEEDVVVQVNTPLERKAKGKIIACISGNHTYLSDDQKR
jgi:dihydroorotase